MLGHAVCDLQTHSTASDGTDAPEALGALAREAGLAAIALTDHDTTQGLPAFMRGCEQAGVMGVPGIEVSADPAPASGALATGTLHILGLFVRHDDPGLGAIHERLLSARQERNPQIIENLRGLGVDIDYGEVVELAQSTGTQVVGRPHIAQVLVCKGYARSVQDAFARYIGEGKPAYARKDRLSPRDAIEAIHRAGGLAIMAHPVQLRYESLDALEHFASRLKGVGLDGIETRHSDHTPALVEQYERLAKKLGLLTSGGSDYHGARKAIALGSQRVPLEVYERLREAADSRRSEERQRPIERR